MAINLKILVVDDEQAVQLYFKKLLIEQGWEVTSAMNIDDAIIKVKSEKFHIIFLDLIMPGKSGEEGITELKRYNPEAAIVIITGYPSVESAVNTLKLGAEDYIKKPFDNQGIIDLINKIARKNNLLTDIDDYIAETVGGRLKKLRKSQKMTLKDLSDKIDLSISLCSQIENGKVMPSLLTLYKICKGLNTKLEEITRDI
ncbi:MAG TPA: response regulator [bacterium]|nr:response regulator [bacterium]